MKAGHKAWSLYVFSSANAISQYSMRELVELGVSWIWMGLESPRSSYTKLKGADTLTLTRELRKHGIKLLGSTIVGLEHHTPGEHRRRDRARRGARHGFPPVHALHARARHAAVRRDDGAGTHAATASTWPTSTASTSSTSSTRPSRARNPSSLLDWAFRRDFERNGPSIYRICRTTLDGWRRYKNDPDPRVRARFAWEARVAARRLRRRAVGHGEAPAPHQSRGERRRSATLRKEVGPRVRPGQPRGHAGCWARCCCGPRGARSGAWPRARPTSRRPSSSAATGHGRGRSASISVPASGLCHAYCLRRIFR